MSRAQIKRFEAFTGKPAQPAPVGPSPRAEARQLRKLAAELLAMAAKWDELADALGLPQ